jgi:hypothetical protein
MLDNYKADLKLYEAILDSRKPKSPLPLSSKSEVKYSKPDTLVQEARKYKSAEEFVKAQGEPLYHRSQNKFDKFDMSKVSNAPIALNQLEKYPLK